MTFKFLQLIYFHSQKNKTVVEVFKEWVGVGYQLRHFRHFLSFMFKSFDSNAGSVNHQSINFAICNRKPAPDLLAMDFDANKTL
jgi:hypothetical protein